MDTTGKVIFGISFIYITTFLGAAIALLFKNSLSEKVNKAINAFSAGIMLAASVWSLLLPAIDGGDKYGNFAFLPAVVGIIVGGGFIVLVDFLCNRMGRGGLSKPKKLFLAMTMHNIPEGLAVGVAFGGAWASGDPAAITLALSVAIGIGIQNIPEGAAVALPMKVATNSRTKGFLFGALSGIVEPIAAIIGFFVAASISIIMPWVLSFAAGCMLVVIMGELLPESISGKGAVLALWMAMIGFVLMMSLDVALG